MENQSWHEVVQFIEDPVVKHLAMSNMGSRRGGPMTDPLLYRSPNNQSVAGRIQNSAYLHLDPDDGSAHRDIQFWRKEMRAIGIDYQVVFPTPMLELGMHPDADVEREISWAYSRWLVEEVLPQDPAVKTMVYLPFNDPEAALRAVHYFAGRPGVVGFMVTSTRYKPVHHNVYAPVYAAIQETGLPLGFHSIFHGPERLMEGMNKFISVHALGFVLYSMVHLTNIVMNGIPERFPGLKLIWIESGLAWIPFLMQRLDNEYAMRTSEAPLLQKYPSDYIRDMWFASQPMETRNHRALEVTMEMIDARNKLLFSSDYPHWDFDLPSVIWDLPFLDEPTRRRILGLNAADLFHLPVPAHQR
jgi:hypothetical protein